MIDSTNIKKCVDRVTAALERAQERLDAAKLDFERQSAESAIEKAQALLDEMPVNQKWADLEIERLRCAIEAHKSHTEACNRQIQSLDGIADAFESIAVSVAKMVGEER